MFFASIIIIGNITNYFDRSSKVREGQEKAKIEAQMQMIKNRIAKKKQEKAKIEAQMIKNRIAKEKIEEEKKKVNFEASIENHYNKLTAVFNSKNYDEATELLDPFIKYNLLDYKDIGIIRRKVTIGSLEKKVKTIPASKTFENLIIYKKLSELDPSSSLYKKNLLIMMLYI